MANLVKPIAERFEDSGRRRGNDTRSLANTWPRVLTRSVESNIWTRESGRDVSTEARKRTGPAELYETRLENSMAAHRLSPCNTALFPFLPPPLLHVGRCEDDEGKSKATANVTVSEISCCVVHSLEESSKMLVQTIRASKSADLLVLGLN